MGVYIPPWKRLVLGSALNSGADPGGGGGSCPPSRQVEHYFKHAPAVCRVGCVDHFVEAFPQFILQKEHLTSCCHMPRVALELTVTRTVACAAYLQWRIQGGGGGAREHSPPPPPSGPSSSVCA